MYDRTILETIDYHRSMLADKVRMRGYLQAIERTVEPGDVVLDIGSGTGILAYFACMAGARKVYAVEQDPLVGLAEAICRQNGFQDRVIFLNDWSDQVELPEPVNVIITETIGNAGFEEGILGWIIDAKERLLAENGRIIPQSVELVVVPAEAPEVLDLLDDWSDPLFGLDFSAVGEVVANNLMWNSLSPGLFLSQPATVAQAELAGVEGSDIAGKGLFIAERAGVVQGLNCWFKSTLGPGITISNGPSFDTPSWTQILLPLERPMPVLEGDRLHIRIQATGNGAHWHWQISNGQRENGANSQSTLSGQLSKSVFPSDLKLKLKRNVYGEVDIAILQMMDGSTTVEEITQCTHSRFPLQFSSFKEAFRHVNNVTKLYGRSMNDQS